MFNCIDFIISVFSILVSIGTLCFLNKEFIEKKEDEQKNKEEEIEKIKGELKNRKEELNNRKEEARRKGEKCLNFYPSDVWKEARKKKLNELVLKEEIRLAEVKYHEHEVKFGKRDLKSLGIISLCVTVIGFLLTHYFLLKELQVFYMIPFLGIGIFKFIRAAFNAAKVLSPKRFESIGSEPGKAIFANEGETEMNWRTLEEYETILKQTFLDIEEKNENFAKSIKDLVPGISIAIGIALFAILQKLS